MDRPRLTRRERSDRYQERYLRSWPKTKAITDADLWKLELQKSTTNPTTTRKDQNNA